MKTLLTAIIALSPITAFAIELNFIDDFELPEKFKGRPVGNISGIVKNDDQLIAISDEVSPHFYVLDPKIANGDLEVKISQVTQLKKSENNNAFSSVDYEDVTVMPNGNLLIASDSVDNAQPHLLPRIGEYTQDGNFVRYWTIDEKGAQRSHDFHAMSSTPNFLFYSTENKFFGHDSGLLKLTKYNYDIGSANYVYELENQQGKYAKMSGMLALDDQRLLTFEESVASNSKGKDIKLYLASINDNSKKVRKMKHISKNKLRKIEKILVANVKQKLEQVKNTTGLQYADVLNVSGVAWGPKLANGNKSLLIITDKNMNLKKKTFLLAFEIKGL